MSKMNILFISHTSTFGGAENNLYRLLSELREKASCYCLFPSHGPLETKVASLNIPTFVSKMKWWIGFESNSTGTILDFLEDLKDRIEKIKEIITAHKIDLVVTNTIVIGEGALAAKILNVPHVWRIAEILSSDPALVAPHDFSLFYKVVLSLSNRILVVSKAVKNELEKFLGYGEPKIVVIYNGIDQERKSFTFNVQSRKEKVILAAGRICRGKGFMTLLEAAAIVNKAMPGAKFKIAGKVAEKEYYRQLLKKRKKYGLEKTFEFIGFHDGIYKLLDEAYIFVLSSTCESFGTVVLEAMSVGRPVIATDSGGPGEVIIDQQSGYIVPIGDAKAMAERIIYLLQNEEIATRIGKCAFERIQSDFSKDKFVNGYFDLFKDAAGESVANIQSDIIIDILDFLGKNHVGGKMQSYDNIANSKLYKIGKPILSLARIIRKRVNLCFLGTWDKHKKDLYGAGK
jgi:glycosyltransferase involved in cell wall biosynthesis